MSAPAQMLLASPPPDKSLHGLVLSSGLSANLKLCLDAADSNSWSGSGTKWLDTSGQGNDFFLGTDGATNAPTFNGTPGALDATNYWTGTTGMFRSVTATPSWINPVHKAGCACTFAWIVYVTTTSQQDCMGDDAGGGSTGFEYGLLTAAKQSIEVWNGGSRFVLANADNAVSSGGAWHFLALSMTDGGTASFFYKDGGYDQVGAANTFNTDFSTASTGAAAFTVEVSAGGNAVHKGMPTTNRYAGQFAWVGTALTKANLDTLYAAIKAARSGYSLP